MHLFEWGRIAGSAEFKAWQASTAELQAVRPCALCPLNTDDDVGQS